MKYFLAVPERSRGTPTTAQKPNQDTPPPKIARPLSEHDRQTLVEKHFANLYDILPVWQSRLGNVGITRKNLHLVLRLLTEEEKSKLPPHKVLELFSSNETIKGIPKLVLRTEIAIVDTLITRAEEAVSQGHAFRTEAEQTHFPAKSKGRSYVTGQSLEKLRAIDPDAAELEVRRFVRTQSHRRQPRSNQATLKKNAEGLFSLTPEIRKNFLNLFNEAGVKVKDIHGYLAQRDEYCPSLATIYRWFNAEAGTCTVRKKALEQFLSAAIGHLEELNSATISQTYSSGCSQGLPQALMNPQ
jgi:hypothetical protein